MTFALVQQQGKEIGKIVGTIWASDKADAMALAPAVLGSLADSVTIQISEAREIPLRVPDSFRAASLT